MSHEIYIVWRATSFSWIYIYVFLGYLNVDIVFAVLNSVDVSVEDRVLTGASRPTISRAQHLNTDTVNTMVNITLCIKPFCKAAKNLQMRPQVTSRKRGCTEILSFSYVFIVSPCGWNLKLSTFQKAGLLEQSMWQLKSWNLNTGSTEPARKTKAIGG